MNISLANSDCMKTRIMNCILLTITNFTRKVWAYYFDSFIHAGLFHLPLNSLKSTVSIENSWFLAAIAALEVQMSVCLSVTLATTALDFQRTFKDIQRSLKDFQRTLKGLPKDFGLYGLQNLLVYKSQPPGLQDLFIEVTLLCTTGHLSLTTFLALSTLPCLIQTYNTNNNTWNKTV